MWLISEINFRMCVVYWVCGCSWACLCTQTHRLMSCVFLCVKDTYLIKYAYSWNAGNSKVTPMSVWHPPEDVPALCSTCLSCVPVPYPRLLCELQGTLSQLRSTFPQFLLPTVHLGTPCPQGRLPAQQSDDLCLLLLSVHFWFWDDLDRVLWAMLRICFSLNFFLQFTNS